MLAFWHCVLTLSLRPDTSKFQYTQSLIGGRSHLHHWKMAVIAGQKGAGTSAQPTQSKLVTGGLRSCFLPLWNKHAYHLFLQELVPQHQKLKLLSWFASAMAVLQHTLMQLLVLESNQVLSRPPSTLWHQPFAITNWCPPSMTTTDNCLTSWIDKNWRVD